MWVAYTWIVVCGGLLSFFTAYGIGANDVANAFGSSVGSKAITIKHAICIAAVFEFAGAVLMGANVTRTVRGSIADYRLYLDAPELFMYGMLSVLLSTGSWLILASYFEMPVSTTHSVIGGIMGFTTVARGIKSVLWYAPSDEFPYMKGVSAIALSWIFSPVLSGCLASIIFFLCRTFVLRSNNSYVRSWYVFPILVFLTVAVNSFFIIFKGISAKVEITLVMAVWITAVIAASAAIIVGVGIVPFIRRKVDRDFDAKEAAEVAAAEALAKGEEPVSADKIEVAPEEQTAWKKFSSTMMTGMNKDIHDAVEEDEDIANIHEFAEKFDPKTEESFKYLQVFTAICDSFAHGANDVANSIGPYAAIMGIYYNTGLKSNSAVPIWILCLGGAGIVVGLATYGYKIMCSIGVKMVRITPSRGFAIELGAAVVIVIGSQLGLPLSTTHCQVGSTCGLGMMDSITKGVNWKLVGRMVLGWVFTLVIVAVTTGACFAQGVFAPSIINLAERNALQKTITNNAGAMITALNQSVYFNAVPGLNVTVKTLASTLRNMTVDPVKNIYAQHVPTGDMDAFLTQTTWTSLKTYVPLSGGSLAALNVTNPKSIFYNYAK